jgi:hypothetical protein
MKNTLKNCPFTTLLLSGERGGNDLVGVTACHYDLSPKEIA